MSDLSLVTSNFFPTAHESFEDTLSSTILAGAATVPITNLSEYNDGDVVVLTLEPGTANEATCIGVKASTPYRLTDVKWTEGNTGVGHNAGVTVIDYDSATHYNVLTKWLKMIANQDGTLKAQPIRDALGLGATDVNGWEASAYTFAVTSGYNKGQKEFDLTIANNNATTVLSKGMRLRLQRGTTAPTQCADLEASSSQYAADTSVSGLIFTDDWTVEAWINPESYGTTLAPILSRYNGTSGFYLSLDSSTGQLVMKGMNAGAGNVSQVSSYQSVPLNKWTHVAVKLDMSAFTYSNTTSQVYINGVEVPGVVSRAGSNPTAIIQAGDLQIGKDNTTNYFDGKISDVRLWNVLRTTTQIRDNMNQQLVGSETNLMGYWKLNGNFTDSTVNANTLTGSGGAVATNLDNPMKDTEYGIITDISYSAPNTTVRVFTGTDHNIPNMTLNAAYYSTQAVPYGFPAAKTKWRVEAYWRAGHGFGVAVSDTWYNPGSHQLAVPVGEWSLGYKAMFGAYRLGTTAATIFITLSGTTSTETDKEFTLWTQTENPSGTTAQRVPGFVERPFTSTAQIVQYLDVKVSGGNHDEVKIYGDQGVTVIFAQCAYA